MDKNLQDKIVNTVKSIMDIDISKLDKKLHFNKISEWDSFNNLMLISKFQEEFGIEFTALEIENTKTVGSLFELIEKKVQ